MLAFQKRTELFCRGVLDKKIEAGELVSAKLTATSLILFYAGPLKEYVDKATEGHTLWEQKEHIPNWQTADPEADRLGAARIDNTPLFSYLRSDTFKTEIVAYLGKVASNETLEKAQKYVWDYVSDKLAHMDFKKAATLVCGAGPNSTFVLKEMLGMLDGDHLELVNERPAHLFRSFRSLGKDEVQRLMCMTYLSEVKAYAKANKDDDVLKLYKRQRSYFLAWREEKKQDFKAMPREERLAFRQARKKVLDTYTKELKPQKPSAASLAGLPKPVSKI